MEKVESKNIAVPRQNHSIAITFQKLCFYLPKGHLLRDKTYAFVNEP